MRVLVLDDDPARSERLALAVARGCPGADVCHAPAGSTPAAAVDAVVPDLVVLGPGTADRSTGPDLVRALRTRRPGLTVVVASARDAARPAVAALRAGAADYVVLQGDGACL